MSIDQFFEAWVETVFQRFTRRYGGLLRVGRRRETITPIAWERPFLGSQKYLLPDLVIEQEDRTIFVDAKQLARRFEIVENVRTAPHGQVDWGSYVTEKLPSMKFLDVPCRYPDLRSDRELYAAIHYVLRKQLASLESQRHAGMIVIELMKICTTLLRLVIQRPLGNSTASTLVESGK